MKLHEFHSRSNRPFFGPAAGLTSGFWLLVAGYWQAAFSDQRQAMCGYQLNALWIPDSSGMTTGELQLPAISFKP